MPSGSSSKGAAPRIPASPWGARPLGDAASAQSAPTASALAATQILVGKSSKPECLLLKLANRHGLVAGATGTGKTVTLQVLAEGLSRAGVSVFAADVKGDLSGLAAPGQGKPAFLKRAEEIGVPYRAESFPVVFWDVFGEQGHPIRATVTEMGPLLLSRILELNDVQEGILNIVFRVADDQGWPIIDLKDLRAMLQFVSDNEAEIEAKYGNLAKASIGAVQRQLLMLENQGAEKFLGEPALDLNDFMRQAPDGRGIINILAADKLMTSPRLYATFLVWMLSELFELLPEVGDLEKPKLVFFFDEAHLLFTDAPKALLDAVQQVVRLIRSKGVGVYFVTQNPLDVPETVLGQKVQHALRAFTPRDQKAVRAAAETFRQNPAFDTEEAITQLAVGEALVSLLEAGGVPSVVERALVAPPSARVGPLTADERRQIVAASPLGAKYGTAVDRASAYEMLAGRKDLPAEPAQGAAASGGGLMDMLDRLTEVLSGNGAARAPQHSGPASAPGTLKPRAGAGRQPMSMTEMVVRSAAQSFARSASTQIAREAGKILRNQLGSVIGGRGSRR